MQLVWCRRIEAFARREALLQLARTDYASGRYHASTPVVLAQLDGISADICGKYFFKSGNKAKRMHAWDSIAAHPDGVTRLVAAMSKGRNKTVEAELSIPLRNGILHGRDLGYANKMVAAKSWAALFALRDWAIKRQEGTDGPPPPPKPTTWRDAIKMIIDNHRQKEALEAWQPRDPGEVADAMSSQSFAVESPEAAAQAFFEAWHGRDFPKMAMALQISRRHDGDAVTDLEEMFGPKELKTFRIVSSEDVAPAITEVRVKARYRLGEEIKERIVVLNVVYEDAGGAIVVANSLSGAWGVNEISALREEAPS